MNHLEDALKKTAGAITNEIERLIPKGDGLDSRLFEAMEYAILAGGTRLRPFLGVTSSELFNVSPNGALRVAAAVEMVHTYSLIHDDLPAMDNDNLRRGRPTCHIEFDEATAILAGDSLLTLAFDILGDEKTHSDPGVRCRLITSLAGSAGGRGMVGGQMIDLVAENENLDMGAITRLQRMKTGELIAFSCTAGAILGKAPEHAYNALHGYAHDLGLAFQITDDLLDTLGNEEDLGKRAGKDADAGKATFVSILGVDRARKQARMLADQAIAHLEMFNDKANLLREAARFVVKRRN